MTSSCPQPDNSSIVFLACHQLAKPLGLEPSLGRRGTATATILELSAGAEQGPGTPARAGDDQLQVG